MEPGHKFSYEKQVTKEEVVEESYQVWRLVTSCLGMPVEEIFKKVTEQHREFNTSYPIVVRYMIQGGKYSRRAMTEYMKFIEKNPWKNKEEYIRAQAKYAQYLHKALNKNATTKECMKVLSMAVDTLTKETKDFEKNVTRAKKSADEIEADYLKKTREELMAMATNMKHLFNLPGDVVQSDVSPSDLDGAHVEQSECIYADIAQAEDFLN